MKAVVICAASLLAFGLHHSFAADSPFSVQASQESNEWTIHHDGKKLLMYNFTPTKYKPYVKELCTIGGRNVLRDAPHDHLHHHALMYGIKVNGINFWEETPGCGVQKPVQSTPPVGSVSAGGKPEIKMQQTIHWVAPLDAFLPDSPNLALLIEDRTLALAVDKARNEVSLRWHSKFEVGGKTNEVTLTGANYHGLGMRFLEELDASAAHVNSGNVPDLSGSKQDVTAGDWGSVSFSPGGQPVTLILFGSPSNSRGRSHFFTMKTPFAYLSATQSLDKEPLVYKKGDKFELDYLVVVYPEKKTPAEIKDRAKRAFTR